MPYFVYMIKTVDGFKKKTYVGYSNNLEKRIFKHNTNKGAKSTKGYKWLLIYKKKFFLKSDAMKYEYKLKKNRIKRQKILLKSEKKN